MNAQNPNQTVPYQRRDLGLHVQENAGLKSKLTHGMLDKAYRTALATLKEEYPGIIFPPIRQLSLEEILGPEALAALR